MVSRRRFAFARRKRGADRLDFLAAAGEIDDPAEANRFLTGKIEFMIGQGQRNRLVLSNRAILAFRQYKRARAAELWLVSR